MGDRRCGTSCSRRRRGDGAPRPSGGDRQRSPAERLVPMRGVARRRLQHPGSRSTMAAWTSATTTGMTSLTTASGSRLPCSSPLGRPEPCTLEALRLQEALSPAVRTAGLFLLRDWHRKEAKKGAASSDCRNTRTTPVKIAALQYVAEHRKWLTGYLCCNGWYHQECPKTTNMIESYNKHLQRRLKTIQGFESFASADKWLSTYALCRRLTRSPTARRSGRSSTVSVRWKRR